MTSPPRPEGSTSLQDLEPDDRLLLVRFVCSFAWADLHVDEAERAFVHHLVRRLDLTPSERRRVDGWLAHPPPADTVDPLEVPREHRQLFLDHAREVIRADGVVDELELDTFSLFERLTR